MDIGEAATVGAQDIGNQDAPTCQRTDQASGHPWKARVNGFGADGTKCSGANLFEEAGTGMDARRAEHTSKKGLGEVPQKESNAHWASQGLAAVSPTSFPLQAHHLIPKNYLPSHDIVVWLCKKWTKNKKYQLAEDAPYNTDHANNGYAMPDALRLKEWKQAKNGKDKVAVAFRVMELTKVQLHQGSHAAALEPDKIRKILEDGELPDLSDPSTTMADSDEWEQAAIHDDGYLNVIGEILNAAAARIHAHVLTCTKGCKKGQKGAKTEVNPLLDTVRLVNRVSYIAKVFLQTNLVFTCPMGAAFAASRGLLHWDDSKKSYFAHKPAKGGGTELITVADLSTLLGQRKG
jgi:hypothetical protein